MKKVTVAEIKAYPQFVYKNTVWKRISATLMKKEPELSNFR
jgi:hypothetical protein